MRNHRLFGVVIAVLLGTSFLHQRPSAPHHHHHLVSGTHLSGADIQLASAKLAVAPHPSLVTRMEPPIGLLRPTGSEFSADLAHLVSAPTPRQHPVAPASAGQSDIGLLRPAGTRYVTQLYAWMAYVSARASAAPTPPTPTPAPTPAPTPKSITAALHPVPVTAPPHHSPTPVAPAAPVAPATQPAGS